MSIFLNGNKVKTFKFPGGEISVNVTLNHSWTDSVISAYITNSDDLITLLLTVDAMRRHVIKFPTPYELIIPYFPYARQDRVCNSGESLSVKVIADLINSLRCNVTINDPHSDVLPALLKNCTVMRMFHTVFSHLTFIKSEGFTLVSPDAGAEKKVREVAKAFNVPMICARKTRDVSTGAILSVQVDDQISDNMIILDDICDGGATFIELGKVLKQRGVKRLYLYVTHGIFSKGFDELSKYFDAIFCAYRMCEPNSKVTTLIKGMT